MNNLFFYQNKKQISYKFHHGNESNAVIALIHGMGEHQGRYTPWIQKFKPYNYAFATLDLPGHGLSDGSRGHIRKYSDYYETIDIFLEKIEAEFPDKPIILYGHSMGGNIVANYLVKHNPSIRCAILSSPWLKLSVKPNFFKFQLGRFILKIFPSFPDNTNLNPKFISRIDAEIERYITDKLVHGKITPSVFFPMFFKGISVINKSSRIQVPTMIFHGTGDMITSHNASEEFAAKNSKIDFFSYENGYHELHHDECRDELFENILDWLSVNVVMK